MISVYEHFEAGGVLKIHLHTCCEHGRITEQANRARGR